MEAFKLCMRMLSESIRRASIIDIESSPEYKCLDSKEKLFIDHLIKNTSVQFLPKSHDHKLIKETIPCEEIIIVDDSFVVETN